jgi:hypothetical protein
MSMMNVPAPFRIVTLLLVLGWFSITTIFAEVFTPKTSRFSPDLALPGAISYGPLADLAAGAAPLRGDLLADIAMARATPAFSAGNVPPTREVIAAREPAIATAQQSLSLAPHSSSTWLLLAMLQNQARAGNSVAEALKMSYLTSPADVKLIPARLAVASSSPAIADADLKNLARGDIRIILTRRPDLRPAITSAYNRGSAEGKAYIGEVVRSLDPGFAASLR